jgi:nucleoside phosphorylase
MPKPDAQRNKVTILTALPVEYNEVRKHLAELSEIVNKGTVYEAGSFMSATGTWKILLAQIGAGNNTAAFEAERAIEFWNPRICLFVGVAGAIKDAAVADVVAATKIYGYSAGKANECFLPRPDVGNSSYSLVQRARAVGRQTRWAERIVEPNDQYPDPKVFVGPIAAGEQVVASTDSEVYSFLKSNYGDSLAVEMEGRGFLSATHANPEVESIVIRGISDEINNKSDHDDDLRQIVASKHAAAFAMEILYCLTDE